jgi:thioredoxin reductase
MKYDVIIIGGSYAGMAAALQLLRARRSVLVVDAGRRRNRAASHSHGFLG